MDTRFEMYKKTLNSLTREPSEFDSSFMLDEVPADPRKQ